jgi:penicillin G amidase
MQKKQLLKKVSAVLVITLITLCTGFYLYLRPKYSGQIKMPLLESPVVVQFDKWGIPHLEAKSRSDLYKAFGYVMAQDRGFQLQLYKRVASGRLSEWFGEKTIKTDIFARTIGHKRWADIWWADNKQNLPIELVQDLEAFCAGVNHYYATQPRALELILLNSAPEPLSPEDVLAFSATMALNFTRSYMADSILGQLKDKLGWKDSLLYYPALDGSQSWVIAPNKSASGSAVLTNDPHIGFSNPGVWYEAHLKTTNFELYGHFLSILPFALIGHNRDMAWALTMSNSDELDLVEETIKEDQYLHNGEWKNLETINEKIYAKDSADIDLKIQTTHNGPIISDLVKSQKKLSLHWHYFLPQNFVVESFYRLNHAKNLQDYRDAIKVGMGPGLNISYADKEGNIAWWMLGHFPIRQKDNFGAVPLKGESLASPYLGELPFEARPHLENPAEGFILSANQKPPVAFDEQTIVGAWESNERYKTLHDELSKIEKLGLDSQLKLLTNNKLDHGPENLLALTKELDASNQLHEVVSKLKSWDGIANKEQVASGFYYEWVDQIMKIILSREIGSEAFSDYCATTNYWMLAQKIIRFDTHALWKDERSKIINEGFKNAISVFEKKWGPQLNGWSWGKIHHLTFENPLGKVKLLSPIFNIGPFSVDGGYMIPNAFRHKLCNEDFSVNSGPSTRRIVDFSNIEFTWGVLPTGNSGHPWSPFYSNQVELYLSGKVRPQLMNWNQIGIESSRLDLKP